MTQKVKNENITPSIEELFVQMDEILNKMESPEISLEDSILEYENGMKCIKECTAKMESVEQKVWMLNENGDLDELS